MSGFGPTVQSFKDQVGHEFLPTYVNNSKVPWTASNSLFTVFFGINDVTNSFAPFASHNDSVNYELVKAYEGLVDQVCLSHSHENRKLRSTIAVRCRSAQLPFHECPSHRSFTWNARDEPYRSGCRGQLYRRIQFSTWCSGIQSGSTPCGYNVVHVRHELPLHHCSGRPDTIWRDSRIPEYNELLQGLREVSSIYLHRGSLLRS